MHRSTRPEPADSPDPVTIEAVDRAAGELSKTVGPGGLSAGVVDSARRALLDLFSAMNPSPAPDLMEVITASWIDSNVELIERWRDERDEIAAWLGCQNADLALLTHFETGASDRHRGGRQVTVLTFGSGRRLVYKPRPIGPEKLWRDLVEWFNRRSTEGLVAEPLLVAPRVRDAGDHGWVEYVEPGGTSPRSADSLLRRAGTLLALLDVLEVRDAHADNVIVSWGHPVLVDAETIAHPRFPRFENTPSLVLTGFMPAPPGGPISTTGRDGLTACLDAAAGLEDQIAPVCAGYGAAYGILERHGAELFEESGPLSSLPETPIRVLLRPTADYAGSLRTSPTVGAREPLPADELPVPVDAVGAVLEAEVRALDRFDIPLFHAPGDGTSLIMDGHDPVPSVFASSGVSRIRSRLGRLGETDRREGIGLIEGVLRLEGLRRAF